MIKAPCMDCLNRQIGCHGNRELYKHYQTEMRKVKNYIRGYHDKENDMRVYREEKIKRLKR